MPYLNSRSTANLHFGFTAQEGTTINMHGKEKGLMVKITSSVILQSFMGSEYNLTMQISH